MVYIPDNAVRISRRSIEVGMRVLLEGETARQTRAFNVASVEQTGESTRVVSSGSSVIYTLTNDDVVRVIPAEGEIWA